MDGRDRRTDEEWPEGRAQRPDRDPRDPYLDGRQAPRRRSRINPLVIALGGLVVILLLAWLLATRGNSDQDKLTGNEKNESQAAQADPEKLCARSSTYDLIKRDLFRRAAQVRGSDQAVFDRLSSYAVLRMESPVMESNDEERGAVNCSGSLSLDLPPGVAVVGGRRTLSSDVDYTVQPAADGSGAVVLLRNADAIITPLATLARIAQPAQSPSAIPAAAPAEPAVAEPQPVPSPSAPPAEPRPVSARPSFDCRAARTRGEIAICSDAGLAALDRNMAAQYGRAVAGASGDERALLRQTRDRFLAYRDRCRDNRCIGDAYEGRMREIRDIVEGRWQPPR